MIGRTGKNAQQFGKQQQRRYQLSYSSADTSPLLQRERENLQQTSTVEQAQNVQETTTVPTQSVSTDSLQRARGQISQETTTVAATAAAEGTDTREVKAEEVAEEVYKLFLQDAKFHRERLGRRFDKR